MKKTTWEKLVASMHPTQMKGFIATANESTIVLVQTLCRLIDSHDAELESLQRAYNELRNRLPEEPEDPVECYNCGGGHNSSDCCADDVLLSFVRELAERGLLTDLTPTKSMRHGDKGWDENEIWWHAYLSRADASIKQRAKDVLKKAGL